VKLPCMLTNLQHYRQGELENIISLFLVYYYTELLHFCHCANPISELLHFCHCANPISELLHFCHCANPISELLHLFALFTCTRSTCWKTIWRLWTLTMNC